MLEMILSDITSSAHCNIVSVKEARAKIRSGISMKGIFPVIQSLMKFSLPKIPISVFKVPFHNSFIKVLLWNINNNGIVVSLKDISHIYSWLLLVGSLLNEVELVF